MTTPHDKALVAARKAFHELSGLMIYLPDEGDMDDFERGRYEGLKAALLVYVDTLALHAPLSIAGKGDGWMPIDRADKSIDRIIEAAGLRIGNSEEYWVRDADGRVYQAVWSDDGRKAYWWDLEGESPVEPVEFMPHPLDPRFPAPPSLQSDTEGEV